MLVSILLEIILYNYIAIEMDMDANLNIDTDIDILQMKKLTRL